MNFTKIRRIFVVFFLIMFGFSILAPSFINSVTNYYKIKITVTYWRVDKWMDGLWGDMEIGFSFYVEGYLDDMQYTVFSKTGVEKGDEEYVSYTYTTYFGFPAGSKVRWFFYENDENPLGEYNEPKDDLICYTGENYDTYYFFVYQSGSTYHWDDFNSEDKGETSFNVQFIYTTNIPPY